MKVLITDKRLNKPDSIIYDLVILLEGDSGLNSKGEIRIIEYIEENQNKFKKSLQDYYYDMSQEEVYKKFQIDESLNYFWILVNEERNQLVSNPTTTKILKYLAIEDILSKYNSFSLYLEIEDADFLEAIIQRFSLNLIDAPIRKKYYRKAFNDILNKLYLMAKAIIWFLKKIIISYTFFKVKINFSENKNSIILVDYFDNFHIEDYIYGKYNSKYWGELNEFLAEKSIYSYIISLWVDNGEFKKYKYRKYVKEFNKKSVFQHNYILDSFVSRKIIIKTLILWFKIIISYIKSKEIINKSPIHNITKITRDFSVYGWIGIRNIYLFHLFQEALKRIPNLSNCIYLQEFQSWEYLLNNAWKNSGHQKILGYIHVPLKSWDLRSQQSSEFYSNKRFMNSNYPDFIGVDCLNSYNILDGNGCPKSIILKVESLRFDVSGINEIAHSPAKNNKVILFIGDYIQESNINFLKYLNEVTAFNHYRVIIKPHPNCQIIIKGYESMAEISNDPLDKLLVDAEMVICGQSTTACINVKYANIKLGILCDANTINLNLLQGDKSVFFIKSSDDMSNFINCKNFQTSADFKFYYENINNSYGLWKNFLKKLYK